MDVSPVSIQRQGETELSIHWSDGSSRRYTSTKLRDACPCATCREKKSAEDEPTGKSMTLPVLSLAEARPLRIERMRPVGNYAYNIAFSDGHDSGIFTFDFLLELGEAE